MTRPLAALLPWVLVIAGGGGEPEVSPEALVAAIQLRYAGVRDLRGDFVQYSFVAALDREEVSRGTLAVKRPGRMRWEYTEPEPRVISIDGEYLRIYSPGDRQLQIAPLAKGAFSPTPMDFLLGDAKLDQVFEPRSIEAVEPGERAVRLVPREEAAFEFMELRVGEADKELRESLLVDLFGNRTRVRFLDLVENSGIEDEVFAISVPDGTERIELR